MGNFVNLRPDSYTESGGLLDDVDVTINDIRFAMSDYDGKAPKEVPIALVEFESDGEITEQKLSVGGNDDFVPDDTGMKLIPVRTKATLTKTAKFPRFMASLVEAGFPLNKIDAENVSCIKGVNVHVVRKPIEYKGIKRGPEDREQTVIVVTKINKLPWENDAATGKGKKGSGGKAGVALDEAQAETLSGMVVGAIVDGGGSLAKKDLLKALTTNADFKALDSKERTMLLKAANDDGWLSGQEAWALEGGVLTLA
ncbi:MAG: hypothetical protein PHQ43_01110 [Dehalococcoidales bacterium]|nr:hypothetical protein [Dehalococcoidales bacterium]